MTLKLYISQYPPWEERPAEILVWLQHGLQLLLKLLVNVELKDVSAFLDLELCHEIYCILSFPGWLLEGEHDSTGVSMIPHCINV